LDSTTARASTAAAIAASMMISAFSMSAENAVWSGPLSGPTYGRNIGPIHWRIAAASTAIGIVSAARK